jgi:hypothetical protein
MAIISSAIVEDSRQSDGRRWIRERHTDQIGLVYEFAWMAASGQDATAVMTARVADINTGLIANEIASNIADVAANGSLANPVLNYSTAAANFLVLRAVFGLATQLQAVMVGDFLNTLSNAQLASAFGITTGQAATLRTNKLAPAAALAASIRASAGQ